MPKGTRTAYWTVELCIEEGMNVKRDVIKHKEVVVDKYTKLENICDMALKDTGFKTDNDWELNSKLSYTKYCDDSKDYDKNSYMKLTAGWLKEAEPLDIEWPNHRKYLVKLLERGIEQMTDLVKNINDMDDNSCYQPHTLSSLRIRTESPAYNVDLVHKSLQRDCDRLPEAGKIIDSQIPFDLDALVSESISVSTEHIDNSVDADAYPPELAIKSKLHEDIIVTYCEYNETITLSTSIRKLYEFPTTTKLEEWIFEFNEIEDKPISSGIEHINLVFFQGKDARWWITCEDKGDQ